MTPPTTDPAFAPRARDDVIFRQLDDEWVVYDPQAEQLHVLNASAAVIWLCCTGDSSLADIVQAVAEAFSNDIDRDSLASEVRTVVASFAEKGLLQ